MKHLWGKRVQLLQSVVVFGCFCLACCAWYQMLFASFTLALFVQRMLLVSVTSAVVLLLHRLLMYRLPPACLIGLWVIVLLQVANVSLPQNGIFAYGLKNQLPNIKVEESIAQSQNTPQPQDDSDQGAAVTIAPSQQVFGQSQTGNAQSLVYAKACVTVLCTVWRVGACLLLVWFVVNYVYLTYCLAKQCNVVLKEKSFVAISETQKANQTIANVAKNGSNGNNAGNSSLINHTNQGATLANDSNDMLQTLIQVKATLGITQNVPIVMNEKQGPLLMGVLRPKIILPKSFCNPNQVQNQGLHFVLLHELIHLKHMDNAWSMIAIVALVTQWYNPLVWCCFICFKQDIERRCDATVASITSDKKAYASLLLNTIQYQK